VVREIEWTTQALNDLHDIYLFISKDSKRYAQIQTEKLLSSVSHLKTFPLLGHKLPEFPNTTYREIIVNNYRIIYRLGEQLDKIFILSILHVRRLLDKI
jgi:toxin ParE1/3/4